MSFQTYEVDHGMKAIIQNLVGLDGATSKVGLPEGGKTSGRFSMDELAGVAADNEFGTDKIPERSFLRSTSDEKAGTVFERSSLALDKILSRTTTVKQAISEVGESLALLVKEKIQSGPFQELHPRTIANKGHDMPLIETGQLFESIQHTEQVAGAAKAA